jgi:hypothetical protein
LIIQRKINLNDNELNELRAVYECIKYGTKRGVLDK